MTAQEIAADERYQQYRQENDCTPVEWYGGAMDSAGNLLSTYNPDSQWDWWVIGGRWGGYFTLKSQAEYGLPTEESAFGMSEDADKPNRGDAARVRDIEPESLDMPYGYIDPGGVWHSKGKMGWWGISNDNKSEDEWNALFLKHIQELPTDTWLVACDLHI